MHKVIAIDGYSASGKGTVANELAKILGYLRVDSGIFYRTLTYLVLKENISLNDDERIIDISKKARIDYDNAKMILNGEDVTLKLRTPKIDASVIKICEIKEIRHIINEKIRNIRNFYDIIIDGRDTTTVIFPDADLKIYLTASFEERVNRRYKEYLNRREDVTIEEVRENIKKRDQSDLNRVEGKLVIADDALVIDSTNMEIKEVVDLIIKELEKSGSK